MVLVSNAFFFKQSIIHLLYEGQESYASSSATIVDTSAPEILQPLTINNTQTLQKYLKEEYQWKEHDDKEIVIVSDILSFFWTAVDKDSGIVSQTLSLQNTASGEVVLSDVVVRQ